MCQPACLEMSRQGNYQQDIRNAAREASRKDTWISNSERYFHTGFQVSLSLLPQQKKAFSRHCKLQNSSASYSSPPGKLSEPPKEPSPPPSSKNSDEFEMQVLLSLYMEYIYKNVSSPLLICYYHCVHFLFSVSAPSRGNNRVLEGLY